MERPPGDSCCICARQHISKWSGKEAENQRWGVRVSTYGKSKLLTLWWPLDQKLSFKKETIVVLQMIRLNGIKLKTH